MRELTPADFNVYRNERLMEVKARSVQRMLAPDLNLFEVARTDWGLPSKEYFVSKVKFVLTSNRRERRLMAGGFEVLLAAAKMAQSPFVLPMVLRALQTGVRRSEVLAANGKAVYVDRRSVLADLHFHDLRHEVICRFFKRGLSVPEVALNSGQRIGQVARGGGEQGYEGRNGEGGRM